MYFTVCCWLFALVTVFFQSNARYCKGRKTEAYTIALGIATVDIAMFCINFICKLILGAGAIFEIIAIGILLAIVIYDMFKITKLSNQIGQEKI